MRQAGAITDYIDVAQAAWWLFFLAFIGIVLLLLREDRREGYPKDSLGLEPLAGPQLLPPSRPMLRLDGTATAQPHHDPAPPVRAHPLFRFAGSPLVPDGNPLTSAVGPGTYTMRRDEPFLMVDGTHQVQPLRAAEGWEVMPGETDLRGMRVLDIRFLPVGRVEELWVDRGVKILRYLEISLDEGQGAGPVLLPIHHCDVDERERDIRVTALHQGQFNDVPRLRAPDSITAREEDMVNSYYAGGRFHSDGVAP
ncbi:MAG TPA: photosynthetic reaction center subunit H [Acetobacteraceae bacterium]